jgi:hypothetical protein
MAIVANALTDVSNVQTRLRLSAGTDSALIEQLINEASAAIESFCDRTFSYQGTIVEQLATMGDVKLMVAKTPLISVASIALLYGDDAATVDSSEYEVSDASIGTVFRKIGPWPWSARWQDGLNFDLDQQPGTERKNCTVTYAAGYVTRVQAAAGLAGGWAQSGSVAFGKLIRPAGQPAQVWEAVVAGATGSVEPTWPAAPVIGQQLVDGAVTWEFTGIEAAVGLGRSLPQDLERGCILQAAAYYRGDQRNKGVKSESVGKARREYINTDLLDEVVELVKRYARWS